MDRLKRLSITTALLFLSTFAMAGRFGVAGTTILVPKDPDDTYGLQAMVTYDPERFTWRQFNIFFDGGFSYFKTTHTPYHQSISILSAAPVIRYQFKQRGPVRPYLDLSIGASYLSQTRFADRNLGMHYAFQDRIGAGVLMGANRQFSLGLSAIHYSNACMSAHNSGISIPVMLNAAYTFD